jgi:hypothetical protein
MHEFVGSAPLSGDGRLLARRGPEIQCVLHFDGEVRSGERGLSPLLSQGHARSILRLRAGLAWAFRHRGRLCRGPLADAKPSSWPTKGLRKRCRPPTDRGHGRRAQHPAKGRPALEAVLFARALSWLQCHRAHDRATQELSPHRHPLKSARPQLSRGRLPRGNRMLLVMGLDCTPVRHRAPPDGLGPDRPDCRLQWQSDVRLHFGSR